MKTKTNDIKSKVMKDRLNKRFKLGGGLINEGDFTFDNITTDRVCPKYYGQTKIDRNFMNVKDNYNKQKKKEMYSTMSLINEDLTKEQFNRQVNTLHQDKSKNQNTHNPDFCEMEWGVEYSLKNKNTEVEDVKHLCVEELIYEDEYGTELSGSFNDLDEISY